MDIQTITLFLQGLGSLVSVLLFAIKPFRLWFLGAKEKRKANQQEEENEKESVRCLLRSEIVRIYYTNRSKAQIHSFEYENVDMLHKAYKAIGGNSFIDRIWEEIQEWEIIP